MEADDFSGALIIKRLFRRLHLLIESFMEIIKNRKIPFAVSGVLFIASVAALLLFGLKPSIDFSGGSLMEVRFGTERPEISEMQSALSEMEGLGEVLVQPSGENKMILRMKFLSEDEHQQVLGLLRDKFSREEVEELPSVEVEEEVGTESKNEVKKVVSGEETELVFELPIGENENAEEIKDEASGVKAPDVSEDRFETIGAAISAHLRDRAMYAAVAVVLAMVLYIGYAFRKVSKPVRSWKYGITAIIALIHDVTITMGVFAVLGRFVGVEVGISFVVALLTIMGYSVNDTIIVFDRIRENLIKRGSDEFDQTVNLGVNQSITRSINTSFTTLLVLFAIFLFGGESVRYFSLALIIGITVGTYSSIFLASPLLVAWEKWRR